MHFSKTIAVAASVVALCVAIAFFAYHVGERRGANKTSMALLGADVLDERTVLKMLERANFDEATAYLNGSIDADVLQLDTLSANTTDQRVRQEIKRVLKVIADDRKRAASYRRPAVAVDERVKAILESVDDGQ